jgi:hypothetical protein
MADRRYDNPTRFEGRGQSAEQLERLRRGPREDMRPGSRAEWDQNRDDYARAQEAVRTRGPGRYHDVREDPDRTGRSGREYARDEGAFYDELREERERPRRYGDRSRPTSLLYDTDNYGNATFGLGAGEPGEPGGGRDYARYGGMHGRTGRERGQYGYGTRGFGEVDPPDVHERIRRDARERDARGPHLYEPRYGNMYGHGPGVENMDPPVIGYGMSRTRADDHETGHGGFIGGGYGRTGRRDMPERPMGKGPKGYTRSDDRIREDICERLMDAWMNAEHVDVRVKDGEVTLVGSVRTRDEKHAIENLAADVLGVKDVHNSLLVLRGGAREESDMRRPVEPPSDTLHS